MTAAISQSLRHCGATVQTELEERKQVFEWLLQWQNALRCGMTYGLERFCQSRKAVVDLVGCEQWDVMHLCADNGSDQLGGVQALKRFVFVHV